MKAEPLLGSGSGALVGNRGERIDIVLELCDSPYNTIRKSLTCAAKLTAGRLNIPYATQKRREKQGRH